MDPTTIALLVPSLAWTLLDFIWQGLLIGWIAALLLGALRGARPQTRYLVACLALLLCAILPVLGLVQRLQTAAPAGTSVLLQWQGGAGASLADAPLVAGSWQQLAGWEAALQSRLPLVVLLWGLGASLLALRLLSGLAWVKRQRAAAKAPLSGPWPATLARMAERMGIGRTVRLGVLDGLDGPVTAGWWRPVVLVPASLLSGMPAPLIEALLAHELAHIKRCDYLVNLIQSAVEVLLFYHPTVWWLSGRIRIERELVADDLAASMLGEPRRLALALSELEMFQFSTSQLAPAAHGGKLMSRIKRLVRPAKEPLNWKLALPVLGLSLACTGLYAWADTPAAPAAPAVSSSAPAAAPAPAASPAPKAARQHRQSEGNALALVRADGKTSHFTTHGSDRGELDALRRSVGSDFIWFREGGQAYMVKDAAMVARAKEAFVPLDKMGVEMEAYGKQMEGHGAIMEALGEEMRQAFGSKREGEDAARKAGKDMRKLAQAEAASIRAHEKAARAAERAGDHDTAKRERDAARSREEALEARLEADAARLEVDVARIHSKQAEAAGRKMENAAKPMEALGKQMEVLGNKMEAEAKSAEAKLRALVEEARKAGLVLPAKA